MEAALEDQEHWVAELWESEEETHRSPPGHPADRSRMVAVVSVTVLLFSNHSFIGGSI